MSTPTIIVDMDRPCRRCGKPGAANGGVCLRCAANLLKAGTYRVAMQATLGSARAAARRREPARIRSAGKAT